MINLSIQSNVRGKAYEDLGVVNITKDIFHQLVRRIKTEMDEDDVLGHGYADTTRQILKDEYGITGFDAIPISMAVLTKAGGRKVKVEEV